MHSSVKDTVHAEQSELTLWTVQLNNRTDINQAAYELDLLKNMQPATCTGSIAVRIMTVLWLSEFQYTLYNAK